MTGTFWRRPASNTAGGQVFKLRKGLFFIGTEAPIDQARLNRVIAEADLLIAVLTRRKITLGIME